MGSPTKKKQQQSIGLRNVFNLNDFVIKYQVQYELFLIIIIVII